MHSSIAGIGRPTYAVGWRGGRAANVAIYHLSASVVKRSAGRSAVAAAAYRSGTQMLDQRYGETHDYTRKQGVVHSEIIAPANAPEWMRDRSQLWNAVEAVETRKNAQLARDITLALPHELNADQRRDLVRQYAHEQFVSRGMIADIAIHEPHRRGDDRNYHAHIMLTMRELTGEGFHSKKATPEARRWNERETLEIWRTEWAAIQNREFERLGINTRVDSRSYENQGIDREPTIHEGPAATEKRRRGELSDLAQENDRRQAANDNTAEKHAELLNVQAELDRIRAAQAELVAEKEAALSAERDLSKLAMKQRQEAEQGRLENLLRDTYGKSLKTVQRQVEVVSDRLENAGTVRRFFRNVTGRTRSDREQLERLQASIADAQNRMREQRQALARRHELEAQKSAVRFRERQDQMRRDIYEAQRESASQAASGAQKKGLSFGERLRRQAELDRQNEPENGPERKQTRDRGRDFEM